MKNWTSKLGFWNSQRNACRLEKAHPHVKWIALNRSLLPNEMFQVVFMEFFWNLGSDFNQLLRATYPLTLFSDRKLSHNLFQLENKKKHIHRGFPFRCILVCVINPKLHIIKRQLYFIVQEIYKKISPKFISSKESS